MRLYLSTQVRRRFRMGLSLGRISSRQQSTLPILQKAPAADQRISGSLDHRTSGSSDQRVSRSAAADQRISGSGSPTIISPVSTSESQKWKISWHNGCESKKNDGIGAIWTSAWQNGHKTARDCIGFAFQNNVRTLSRLVHFRSAKFARDCSKSLIWISICLKKGTRSIFERWGRQNAY